MKIDMSPEDKVSFLVSISKRMGLSSEDVLAIYLLLGDKIFFLFDLLQGQTVKFPSMRSFHHGLSMVGKFKFIKLKHSHYVVNGVDSYRESIVAGDSVCIDGADVEIIGSPLVFLGGFYVLVKNSKEEKDE